MKLHSVLILPSFLSMANAWGSDWKHQRIYSNTRLSVTNADDSFSRRDLFKNTAAALTTTATVGISTTTGVAKADALDSKQQYVQRFPTLFAPLYGEATRKTIKRSLGQNIWALEQNLELGPLQTPLRCVVVRLKNEKLWVHAPLAPTQEFFELVESCAEGGGSDIVAHIVVPTYALEHKVFVKDAAERWPSARIWTCPGQFTFPFSVSEDFVFGKAVSGVLSNNLDDATQIPWRDEIGYDTLAAGTFNIGSNPQTFYETAFFHEASKSLIVTDSLALVPKTVPPLNDPGQLLLVSKRSTSDPQPEDTEESRLVGWEKTALLVSYFFPEHEEPDPEQPGVVTWTDGWHDNFNALSGRLLVPPVVRTLIYAQDPARVQEWVDRVAKRWQFEQIIPAHFEAPISATPKEFEKAFRFLKDDTIDPFPVNDLARGLKPIADIALKRL